jgi:hypothetical protein
LRTKLLAGCLLQFFCIWQAQAAGDFALDERALIGGYAYEAKMENEEEYEGGKLVLQGHWAWSAEEKAASTSRACCRRPAQPTTFIGVLDAELRYGFDSSEFEVIRLGVVPWARAWDPSEEQQDKWEAARDTVELGATRYLRDDPLELDSYLEIAIGRVGRGLSYRPKPSSPNVFSIEGDAALGWAWAESTDAAYQKVSNPFVGIYLDAAWTNERWGELYGTARFVNGFSFSNPSRGNPTAREAYVRAGYRRGFGNDVDGLKQYVLDVHFHKRSFYFTEDSLPERYTWVRAYVAELRYRF